jgi:hypothetical protein
MSGRYKGGQRPETYTGVIRDPRTGKEMVGRFNADPNAPKIAPEDGGAVPFVRPIDRPDFVPDTNVVLKIFREEDWDNINPLYKEPIIRRWKVNNPGWDNRELVYNNLKSNKVGTTWGHINNIIASISGENVAPRPGIGLLSEDSSFYNVTYPMAATILWWANTHGISALSNPVWYNRIYTPNVVQTLALQKNETEQDLKDVVKGAGDAAGNASSSTQITLVLVLGILVSGIIAVKSVI